MSRIYLVYLLFVFYLTGCKTFNPKAPSEAYTPFVFKPELSHVNIPVQLSASKIESSINSQIAGLLYEDNDLQDDDLMMKLWKQENISFNVIGEEFQYRVPLKVWVKAGFKIEKFGITISEYEETDFALALNFTTKIFVDEKWKVNTVTTMSGYDWITKPVLNWGIIKVPLAFIAGKVINTQKQKIALLIDEQAKEYIDIKQYVEEAWNQIQKPILLSNDPVSWLKVTPVEVQMSPLMGRAGLIQSSIGLKAYSQIDLGKEPKVTYTPLPALKVGQDESGSFSVFAITDIPYEFAERMAKKYFEGTIYTFKEGKKAIKVESVNLYGSSGNMIIALKVSGSLEGNIYLNGVPYYDALTQSIKVKNVDFDMDTKNKLLKSADWLAHGVFAKKIELNLTFTIKDELAESKLLIEKGLSTNRINKNIVLTGRLSQLLPQDIYLTEESIKAVILIKGILELDIEGFE